MDIQDGSRWPDVILVLTNSLQDGHLCETQSCFTLNGVRIIKKKFTIHQDAYSQYP